MPLLIETEAGRYMTKLRGAAQGTAPLIAEIIVAELAEALGLSVPERILVQLDAGTPSDDRNDEVADLRHASVGLNLGFAYLEGARELRRDRRGLIDDASAVRILWLDWLVANVDRTWANPNILIHAGAPQLIDHGAALHFQYGWSDLTEESPTENHFDVTTHLFVELAPRAVEAHDALAAKLSRAIIDAAVAAVPSDFLESAGAALRPSPDAQRHRAHFAAFLWKRLKAPPAWD